MSTENQNLQSIDVEQSILATLMSYEGAFDHISGTLSEEDFTSEPHKILYRAISNLASNNQPYDSITVYDWLGRNGLMSVHGCPEPYFAKVTERLGSMFSLEYHAGLVRSKSDRRKALQIHHDAIEQLKTSTDDTADISNEVMDQLTSVLTGNSDVSYKLVGDMMEDLALRLRDRARNGAPFIKTGFIELDNKLMMSKGDLVVVAARPSMGKTALVMNWLSNIAQTYEGTAVFFSLEMRADQVMDRLTSAEAGVRMDAIRSGGASEDDWANIMKFIDKQKDLRLAIVEKPEITIGQIRTELNRISRQVSSKTDGKISVIAVDYLQIMGGLDGPDRVNKIGTVTRTLKALGKEYDCPVILLSQLSRSVEQRPNKRPISSDLRDSGTIEQDADIIAMIYRDDYYKSKEVDEHNRVVTKPDGQAEIILTKNRNGATGAVTMGFEGHYSRFVEKNPEVIINLDDFYNPSQYAGGDE